ncbi:MAG: hypothetical protein ABI564_15120, partial [Ideonella sp.]
MIASVGGWAFSGHGLIAALAAVASAACAASAVALTAITGVAAGLDGFAIGGDDSGRIALDLPITRHEIGACRSFDRRTA